MKASITSCKCSFWGLLSLAMIVCWSDEVRGNKLLILVAGVICMIIKEASSYRQVRSSRPQIVFSLDYMHSTAFLRQTFVRRRCARMGIWSRCLSCRWDPAQSRKSLLRAVSARLLFAVTWRGVVCSEEFVLRSKYYQFCSFQAVHDVFYCIDEVLDFRLSS